MEHKFWGKKCLKFCVYLARLTSFLEILENAVSFVTGNFGNSNQIFHQAERAPGLNRVYAFLTGVCYSENR